MTRAIGFALALLVAVAQAPNLKIVVIAGEDAVNIIQQKTATAPIVEVRDRNDLPVGGVPVTFTIAGQNAAFGGGLQTITVTSNAAGRAAVTSLNPLGAGAVQINVTATSQGQTAAVTITQTNFATAAAASAAGAVVAGGATGAAAAGVAAAGGGGLGAGAITAIVGGIGAAGVVGAQAAGLLGGETTARAPCSYALNATGSFRVDATTLELPSFPVRGGVNVEKVGSDCEEQPITAVSNASFLTVTLPPQGSTVVDVTAEANPRPNPPRTGTITIIGQTVTVHQKAQCNFSIAPLLLNFPAAGGTQTLTLTAAPAGCDQAQWSVATGTNPWISANPLNGSGSAMIAVTLEPNPTRLTRGATIFISNSDLRILVTQAP